jgi:acyl carrier protein
MMMTTATVNKADLVGPLREVLNRVTNGRIKADEVSETANVFDDLGLTSLELLELRFEVETQWNVVIDDQDIGNIQTVADVIGLIAARTAGRQTPAAG